MTTTYHATETAKLVRVALKKNFPGIKFSVTSSRHTINVSWTDGPIDPQVKAVTNTFGGMGFDGMQDMDTYHKQDFNGEQVQFYCYSPYTKRKLSMDFALKIKASMDRQNIPCPSVRWCEYDKSASFQTQELEWGSSRQFHDKVKFFTVENVDSLDFWTKRDANGCRTHKSDHELLQEVVGATKVENPILSEVSVTQNEQKNGVEIGFSQKPAQAILDELKRSDFSWSRRQNIWYAKRTAENLAFAYEMAGMANGTAPYELSEAEISEVRKLQQVSGVVVSSNVSSIAVFLAKRSDRPTTAIAETEKA
jgi:Large polyvalent protein associated domain 29